MGYIASKASEPVGMRRRKIMSCKVSLNVISSFLVKLVYAVPLSQAIEPEGTLFSQDTYNMMVLKNISVALAAITAVASQQVTDLSDSLWTLENPSLNVSVPAAFPSYVHLDLYASQVIGEPEYGLNDFNLRWVWMGQNWTYRTESIPNM